MALASDNQLGDSEECGRIFQSEKPGVQQVSPYSEGRDGTCTVKPVADIGPPPKHLFSRIIVQCSADVPIKQQNVCRGCIRFHQRQFPCAFLSD